jgi:hypothetical protein
LIDLFELGIEVKFVYWPPASLQCPFNWVKTANNNIDRLLPQPMQPPPQVKQPVIKPPVEEEKKKEEPVVKPVIKKPVVEEEKKGGEPKGGADDMEYLELLRQCEREGWTMQMLEEALQKCKISI